MSNRQFWSILNLEFIYNTTFGKLFYQTICELNENSKLDYLKFLEFNKFLQFVGIFTKKFPGNSNITIELRKKFVFRLFDLDNNEEIDKLEFRNFINAFLEMILICNFDDENIQGKINSIRKEASTNLSILEKSLDQYVEEVYSNITYDGYVMTYEEWDRWISAVDGIIEIVTFQGRLNKLMP